ncbi:uncharacterized protein LOC136028803 [Artemia franciscana]|uniref:PH domain-containing protein n=1 Tax=Artemia franciscana TaxID=6661 RepID=A0AA88H7H3_ARTSF|nr:hypothetical protein QYM36_014658 [Artemia franciscana]
MCSCDSIPVIPTSRQLKAGVLLRYRHGFLSSGWSEVYTILYEDSTLIWFKQRFSVEVLGGVYLREWPESIVSGDQCAQAPHFPGSFPPGCNFHQVLVVGSKRNNKYHWFLCESLEDLNSWMVSIASTVSNVSQTLPSAPPFNQEEYAEAANSEPEYGFTYNGGLEEISTLPDTFQNRETRMNPYLPKEAKQPIGKDFMRRTRNQEFLSNINPQRNILNTQPHSRSKGFGNMAAAGLGFLSGSLFGATLGRVFGDNRQAIENNSNEAGNQNDGETLNENEEVPVECYEGDAEVLEETYNDPENFVEVERGETDEGFYGGEIDFE